MMHRNAQEFMVKWTPRIIIKVSGEEFMWRDVGRILEHQELLYVPRIIIVVSSKEYM